MDRTTITAIGLTAMLLLSAVASMPVGAAETTLGVATEDPTDVTVDAATLHGNLTALENASNATIWFEYWPEGDSANATSTANLTATDTGAFSIDVDELDPDTTYVVVAHAETENASAVGSEVSFTTDAEEKLVVVTNEATDVTDAAATINGELTSLEGVGNATVWFEYWEDGDRDNSSTTTSIDVDEPRAFSAELDGLANNTTYEYVAHAEAENESATGDTVVFTTGDRYAPLGVETRSASDVTNTSATLNGELTGLEGEAEADVWFEYWVHDDRANSTTTATGTLTAPRSFSAAVSDLENDTTYVYVAHAEANDTTVSGDEVTFSTGETTGGAPSWDGEGSFGQWLSSVIKNLVPPDGDVPFGQLISDIVTQNNPGADHRSDKANPGGNGPPEHAKNKSADSGPPGNSGNDDKRGNGNSGGNGPPAHANNDAEDDEESTPTPA